jgi:hypothetical protein
MPPCYKIWLSLSLYVLLLSSCHGKDTSINSPEGAPPGIHILLGYCPHSQKIRHQLLWVGVLCNAASLLLLI